VLAKTADLLIAALVFALMLGGFIALDVFTTLGNLASGGNVGAVALVGGVLLGSAAFLLLRTLSHLAVVRYVLGHVPTEDELPELAVGAGGLGVADVVAIALTGPAAAMMGLVVAQRLAPAAEDGPELLRFALVIFECSCMGGVVDLVPFRLTLDRRERGRASTGRVVLDALAARSR
jgi:hypothetical protein